MELIVCEDNEAVNEIVSNRTLALRHVSRTRRINLDWTYDTMQSQGISLKYVNTKNQIADMMTKAFTRRETWETLLTLSALGTASDSIKENTLSAPYKKGKGYTPYVPH